MPMRNVPSYQPDTVEILDRAIALMSVPHAIVRDYQLFATDEDDQPVEYGDPAACRFCVAGVVEHAAMLTRRPGKVLSETDAYMPMDLPEAEQIAEACQVTFRDPTDDPAWDNRSDDCQTLIEIFDRAWRDGDHGNDPELVRESVVQYLQRGRDHIASELSGVGA